MIWKKKVTTGTMWVKQIAYWLVVLHGKSYRKWWKNKRKINVSSEEIQVYIHILRVDAEYK